MTSSQGPVVEVNDRCSVTVATHVPERVIVKIRLEPVPNTRIVFVNWFSAVTLPVTDWPLEEILNNAPSWSIWSKIGSVAVSVISPDIADGVIVVSVIFSSSHGPSVE